jgi:hypothetical protein
MAHLSGKPSPDLNPGGGFLLRWLIAALDLMA